MGANKKNLKRAVYLALAAAAAVAVALAFMPDPIRVETARAVVGPLEVTVDEDGETRAHDRFVVAAPIAGRVERIVMDDGDPVKAGQQVARIWPAPLGAREREEQLARIAAAEAALAEARSQEQRAAADFRQARRDRERVENLVRDKFVSPQAAERARVTETTASEDLDAAKSRVRVAEADLRGARAVQLALEEKPGGAVAVRSPVAGRILRITEKSERVVAAGAPLLTLGDPQKLEIVVDLLSQEAVKVRPGMDMLIEGWGGGKTLRARVRTVEPFAFTKVSALGVEEQRVNVVGDFVDPPGPLGDGYRVEARIVVWRADQVLKVPMSALFRHGDAWAVFAVEGGRARLRAVEPGQRGALEAEIHSGLREGEAVVRHPANELKDGARVAVQGA
jgi:HlyD family secretion protein